jgi:hypothetical protein
LVGGRSSGENVAEVIVELGRLVEQVAGGGQGSGGLGAVAEDGDLEEPQRDLNAAVGGVSSGRIRTVTCV